MTDTTEAMRAAHQSQLKPQDNKFHKGAPDGKHYWLTPAALFEKLKSRFGFNFDPCPYPKPDDFDGLTCEWGSSSYVNPPFGSIMHEGKKKGATAWVRKAIVENKKGKRVVMVHPMDKWVLMMIEAGAKIENLGDVKWCATEDGSEGKGTGRHIAMFILEPPEQAALASQTVPKDNKWRYTADQLADAMQAEFDEHVADTRCVPSCFSFRGANTSLFCNFHGTDFVDNVVGRLLAAAPAADREDTK